MKLWKKILLHVPKAGLAYRAFRWFRITRKYKLVGLAKVIRRLKRIEKKARKEGVQDMKGALQSKTIWGGIAMVIGFVINMVWGVDIDQQSVAQLGVEITSYVFEAVGAAMVYYGRLKAAIPIKGFIGSSPK